jgi:hypothetical protein
MSIEIINMYMKFKEFAIAEDPVSSSWIADLTLVNGPSGDITMALGNGRRYRVRRAGEQVYRAWMQAGSKGQFWHSNVKNQFVTVRLM